MAESIIAPSGGGSASGGVTVRKNTGADVGTRPRLNLIEGSNVTLTVADDAGGNEVDITVAASGGGGSSDVVAVLGADVVHATASIVLSDITGLTFSTSASATEVWRVELMLITTMNAAGGINADWLFGWTVSGGQTGNWSSQLEREVAFGGTQPFAPTLAQTKDFGSQAITGMIQFLAIIAGNGSAGAVQPQFATRVATAGSIATIKKHSYLIARKLVA